VDPATLRLRAGALRRLAHQLEHSGVHTLRALAGADTWQCPAADEYVRQVDRFSAELLDAADDLRRKAAHLDQQATEREHDLLVG
jgi:hypothetical protein